MGDPRAVSAVSVVDTEAGRPTMIQKVTEVRRYYERHGIEYLLYTIAEKLIRNGRLGHAKLPGVIERVPAEYYRRRFRLRGARSFTAPLDPLRLLEVDPDTVSRSSARPLMRWEDRVDQIGVIRGGKWDLENKPPLPGSCEYSDLYEKLFLFDEFDESIFYRSMVDHFEKGVEWERTEFFDRLIDEPDAFKPTYHRCRNERDVVQRCHELDRLFERIEREGYRSQSEFHPKFLLPKQRALEILVDIGRNGEILFVDGRHRLAIAKILDLDAVPVTPLVRHEQWMEKRDRAWQRRVALDHPDINYS